MSAMQGWTTGQLSMPLIILFWLIVLSVQVWALSRRVADWEARELPDDPSQHMVTVSELLDRHDSTRCHQPTAGGPSALQTTEPFPNTDVQTAPLARP